MSDLRIVLANLPPQESDAHLSRIWRDFRNTAAYEALLMALEDILKEHDAALLKPDTPDRARAYAAGAVSAVRVLYSTMNAAMTFDPAKADYSEVPPSELSEDLPDQDPIY